MLVQRIKPDQFVGLLASALGCTVKEAEVEAALLSNNLEPFTRSIVSRFSAVLNMPEETIYRVALFLKQQKSISERENVESLRWEVERNLAEKGGSDPEKDNQ